VNLRPRRSDAPDINLTPLIDVVFLLLIFFMVSTTFKNETRVKVRLPEVGQASVQPQERRRLEVAVDRHGVFYVNDRRLADGELETLRKAISRAANNERDLPVVIKADAGTPHQAVLTVMDAASQVGLVRFSFAATRRDVP
jgi:biopolymer transport protein ExbD